MNIHSSKKTKTYEVDPQGDLRILINPMTGLLRPQPSNFVFETHFKIDLCLRSISGVYVVSWVSQILE